MTDQEYARKLDEVERLINDPDVPMQPGLVWALLDEIAEHPDTPSPAALPGSTAIRPRIA